MVPIADTLCGPPCNIKMTFIRSYVVTLVYDLSTFKAYHRVILCEVTVLAVVAVRTSSSPVNRLLLLVSGCAVW